MSEAVRVQTTQDTGGATADGAFADRPYDAITDLFVGEIGSAARSAHANGSGGGQAESEEHNGPARAIVHGLMVLKARCPLAPSISLARDGSGGAHLLADADGPEDCFRLLLTAAAWVRGHAEMVGVSESEPVLHVLTRTAEGVSRLLATGVRVHLEVGERIRELT
jgi:hypothetical protein